jgi:hypothetical protein
MSCRVQGRLRASPQTEAPLTFSFQWMLLFLPTQSALSLTEISLSCRKPLQTIFCVLHDHCISRLHAYQHGADLTLTFYLLAMIGYTVVRRADHIAQVDNFSNGCRVAGLHLL